MLDQNKINQFAAAAKAKGYTDAQINAEIARKKKELEAQTAPKAPVDQPVSSGMDMSNPGFATDTTTPTTPAPEKTGLFGALKGAGKWVADTFFPATKNFVQDVSSGLAVKGKDYQDMVKSNQDAQAMVSKLVERAKNETDPEKKKRLLDLAREQSANLGKILEEGTPKFSKDVEKNPLERGLAVGTEIGTSVLTPEAKGAGAGARIFSAAKQGAMLAGSRAATSLEDMTPEERLKKTLTDAGLGALTVGALQGGSEAVSALAKGSQATKKIGENITEKGGEIRQGVRKIHEPAGVWSASKEQKINETLDKLNIGGTAGEQYTQLEPAYNKLTKAISDFLDESAKPVASKDLQTNVQKALEDIPGDVLAESQGAKEFEKITKEISKIKDSKDLFAMKQWLNGRLGRVYAKLEKGNPLSPAEEVILESRDVIDKTITKVHPEIKDLTMTQSHLRDAAPSLAKARLVVPTQRIMGTTVPASITQKAQDIAGKGVQNAGKVVEKAGQFGSAGFGFAEKPVQILTKGAQKVAPLLVTPSTPFENVPNVTSDTQGNESQAAQNENGQTLESKTNHKQSVAQTVTGFTVEQHLKALSQAKAAGDTQAAKAIQQQLDIEQAYQKTLPSAKPLTAQQKKDKASADSGLRALDKMEKEMGLDPNTGTYSKKDVVLKAAIPGSLGARQFATARKEASDVITRLRTGAALNKDEAAYYMSQLPSVLDSDKDIAYKMQLFRTLFEAIANPDSAAPDLQDQLGGFSQ